MKRLLNSVTAGASFALGFFSVLSLGLVAILSLEAAFGWPIRGRDSEGAYNIVQTGIPATSVEQGITATPTGTQATSYQLSAGVSQVTTSTTGPDGVRLPSVTNLYSPTNLDASLAMVVANHTANSINLFPFEATTIIVSGGVANAAGAAVSIPTNKVASCYSVSLGRWYCQVA